LRTLARQWIATRQKLESICSEQRDFCPVAERQQQRVVGNLAAGDRQSPNQMQGIAALRVGNRNFLVWRQNRTVQDIAIVALPGTYNRGGSLLQKDDIIAFGRHFKAPFSLLDA
jgi:hypothetical protein